MPASPGSSGPIMCLGEAIVDLVCERELDSPSQADSFHPHFGGALANVAVAAARAGARAALAGGVGDDPWGRWLRDRLRSEGVELRWFRLVAGLQTPLAFVTFDRELQPTFEIYGDGIDAAMHAVGGSITEAVGASDALVFGSNTLVGEPERELTLRARELALERGIPVVFDPNLRPNRWRDLDRGIELCREACPDAFVVRANLPEARALTGLAGAGAIDAAEALGSMGARIAVVTNGSAGAVARGETEGEAIAPEVDVVAPLGAGDAFLGTLLAGCAASGWAPVAVSAALEAACRAGALACTGWGALQ